MPVCRRHERRPPPPDSSSRAWGGMRMWEAYAGLVLLVTMIFVLSPSIDAARYARGDPPLYPMIDALVPTNPPYTLAILACPMYGIVLAVPLTLAASLLRRVMPRRNVWLATMLIVVPIMTWWISVGIRS